MKRFLAFSYGVVSYIIFLGSFLYAIGFVGEFIVPKTINSGQAGAFLPSLLINMALLTLFAFQHSGMARPGFKKWWTKVVPKSIERSTYVLFSSLSLILLYIFWQPLPGVVWNLEGTVLPGILNVTYFIGWGILLMATFMISHAHLFGLKQVYEFFRKKEIENPKFQTPGFYKFIRHPIMLGFIIAFWSTPLMTVGHILFAGATTGYILIAVQLEERDLLAYFGDRYRKYREQVPMFIPRPKKPVSEEQIEKSQ